MKCGGMLKYQDAGLVNQQDPRAINPNDPLRVKELFSYYAVAKPCQPGFIYSNEVGDCVPAPAGARLPNMPKVTTGLEFDGPAETTSNIPVGSSIFPNYDPESQQKLNFPEEKVVEKNDRFWPLVFGAAKTIVSSFAEKARRNRQSSYYMANATNPYSGILGYNDGLSDSAKYGTVNAKEGGLLRKAQEGVEMDDDEDDYDEVEYLYGDTDTKSQANNPYSSLTEMGAPDVTKYKNKVDFQKDLNDWAFKLQNKSEQDTRALRRARNIDMANSILEDNESTAAEWDLDPFVTPDFQQYDPASLSLKSQSVDIARLNPNLGAVVGRMSGLFPGLVITSGNDSQHTKNSAHYDDDAVDIGANSSDAKAYKRWKQSLPQLAKSYGFRYIDEGDHIHVSMSRKGKLKEGGKVNDNNGYLISNLDNFTDKKIIDSNYITTNNMAFPILANGYPLYPNTGDFYIPGDKVVETPMMQSGGTFTGFSPSQIAGIERSAQLSAVNTGLASLDSVMPTTIEMKARKDAKIKAGKQEVARRKTAIAKSNASKGLADQIANSAVGDKMRMFPNDPESFFDDYLNPARMVGSMADNLGQTFANPNSSAWDYTVAIGEPLLAGVAGRLGSKAMKNGPNSTKISPQQSTKQINSISSGMDAVWAKTPEYNSHLYRKSNYVPPTTDDALKAFIKLSDEEIEALSNEEFKEYVKQLPLKEKEALYGVSSKRNPKINFDVEHPDNIPGNWDINYVNMGEKPLIGQRYSVDPADYTGGFKNPQWRYDAGNVALKWLYEKEMKPLDRVGLFLNLPKNQKGGKIKKKNTNPYHQ